MNNINKHKVEIKYVGGTVEIIEEMPLGEVERLIAWVDNNLDKTTFKTNITKENRTMLIRKDLILFINIY